MTWKTTRAPGTSSAYFHANVHPTGQKMASRWSSANFSSIDEKFERLFEMCHRGGRAIGTSARELLNVGGSRPIVWIDVDSRDHAAVERWKSSPSFPFPKGSFVDVPSTTGKHHLYVACDRIVRHEECFSFYELTVRTAEDLELFRSIDRAYGPESPGVIYIPGCARGEPTLPQRLVENLPTNFVVPRNLRPVPFPDWFVEKRKLWTEVIEKRLHAGGGMKETCDALELLHEIEEELMKGRSP